MPRKQPLSALIASLFALCLSGAAYADSDHNGGEVDEINEHAANGSDMDHVAAMVGGANTRVDSTPDGHYEITFSDGSVVDVTPQGNTRMHTLSTSTTETSVDSDGHLHVRTRDGYEMTVASAQHSETETRTLLEQNGWGNVTTSGNRISGVRQDGSAISLEADYQVNHDQVSGAGQYRENSDGVDIGYRDGTRQHYHGASPDINQLRSSAQALGYAVTFNSDGSANANGNGASHRVKLSPALAQGGATQRGIRVQSGRVIMQYDNGLEQEIIITQ